MHQFWDNFDWFCLKISSDAKYFFLSYSRQCDQGLIVVIVFYFQIWNKKPTILLLIELLAVTWVPFILRQWLANVFVILQLIPMGRATAGAKSTSIQEGDHIAPSWIYSIKISNDTYKDFTRSTIKLAETKCLPC